MPHIVIKMYKGRTEEKKKELTDAVAKAIVDTINCSDDHVSVAIEEFDKEVWGEKVFYPEIMTNIDNLYKKPNYKPE